MDGRTDGRTDGRMDGRTDGRTDGFAEGWINGRTDGQKDSFMQQLERVHCFHSIIAIHTPAFDFNLKKFRSNSLVETARFFMQSSM